MKAILNIRTEDDGMVHLETDDTHLVLDARVFDEIVNIWVDWRKTDIGRAILHREEAR